MAKFHAWYWLKPDLVGYKWPYSLNEKLIDQTLSEISKCLTLFLSRFGEYIQTGEYGVLEALPEYYKSAVKPLLKSPMTLVHNDFAMKNILIIDRGDRTYHVLVDWANVARAPGVRDLSFFIQTSIAPRTRSLKEMELLRHYWGRLRIEGVSDYSFDSMVLDYRRSVLIDLFRMIRFGGREFFRPMYESIVRHDILGRTGSAEELDLLSLLQENHK